MLVLLVVQDSIGFHNFESRKGWNFGGGNLWRRSQYLHEFDLLYTINCVLCWCLRVRVCVCVLFTNGKLGSDFKHSKSFRGTFITSRISTVLQLVLVSLCFMASAYSYSVHYPFGTNRCASNLVRPICYLFCCRWFFNF